MPRRWRYRLAPEGERERHRSRSRDAWLAFRRTLWSPGLWTWALILALVFQWWGAAIGAGFVTVLTRLARSPERPPAEGLDPHHAVCTRMFVHNLAGATGAPLLPGNTVELLNNGDAFYPRMLADIAAATSSISFEGYIYWAGSIGTRFATALAERSREGVTVKVLLDAVGSAMVGDEILSILESGGVQVAWYNPIRWYTLERTNHRTHRKSLILDGRIAYTGGAGIADQWLGNAEDTDHWRDLHVRVDGPAAGPLQTGFATSWLMTTGELVNGPLFFPPPKAPGDVDVQTLLGSPGSGASTLRMLYYLSLASAWRDVLIANPYFVPDPIARDLLVGARRRGARVTVLVSGDTNDSWLARHNSVRLYGPLLAEGIRIFEYQPTMLHYKAMVVDGCWATVGTCNFDNRSFALNEESNVSWHDTALVRALEATIREDLARAREITLDAWQHRGWPARAQELVASILQDQV
ncbi:MAG: cardiolipin synthase B [Acidobacteria bacterium]|nr:cardiolipin synthase B [Acidobacteriota bacterium]